MHHIHTRFIATVAKFLKKSAIILRSSCTRISYGSVSLLHTNVTNHSLLNLNLSSGFLQPRTSSHLTCDVCFHTSMLRLPNLHSKDPGVSGNLRQSFRQFCSVSRTCWNCNTTLTNSVGSGNGKAVFFCHACKIIQPVDAGSNYFQIMQCEQKFDLDVDQLTKTFRSLQTQLHPDKFSIKPQTEQVHSADQSAAVNRAYRTLLKPLSRGLYLLELNGLSIEEGDSLVEPDFLMEIMEINEELAEAETDDLEVVKQIRAKNNVKYSELIRDLSRAFSSSDFQSARGILVYLKYYANIEDKAKEKLGTDA